MKKLLRLAALSAVIVTVVWLTRERLLPTPRVPDEPPPHYRSTPPAPQTDPDDLTEINGIGPVYATRLRDAGIQSFRSLSEIDTATVAEAVGTSPETVAGWVNQAKAKLS